MGTTGLLPKWVGEIVAAIGQLLGGLGDAVGLAVLPLVAVAIGVAAWTAS